MILTRFEHGLLRQMDALDDGGFGPKTWGAAVGEATEFLHRNGCIARVIVGDVVDYQLTAKGRKLANSSWYEIVNHERTSDSTLDDDPL